MEKKLKKAHRNGEFNRSEKKVASEGGKIIREAAKVLPFAQ